MQRLAVTLRHKQEHNRAEQLLLKAIGVKKQINKTEYSMDIAYLYSELAVTYNQAEDMDKGMTCVRKQLAIYE